MKLAHWFSRLWNLMDAIFIVTYLMAQPLRFNASTFRWGRSLICCNNMYWCVATSFLISAVVGTVECCVFEKCKCLM